MIGNLHEIDKSNDYITLWMKFGKMDDSNNVDDIDKPTTLWMKSGNIA